MGKGEIACYEEFLLFPQCFQKACFHGRQKVSLLGNGLTHNPNFLRPWKRSCMETLWEKKTIFQQCFLPFPKKKNHFDSHIYFVVCKFFQFGQVQKFVGLVIGVTAKLGNWQGKPQNVSLQHRCHNFFRQIQDCGLNFPGFALIFWDRLRYPPPPPHFFFFYPPFFYLI